MKQTPKNLIIIEKYEEFVNYTYPVLQNIPRKHGVVKERILLIIFEQVELFYKALKSGQKSKLYEADSNLASIKLAEVGKILHSWITKDTKMTQKKLKEFLYYDKKTGVFSKDGIKQGSKSEHGYIRIYINWKIYLAHRIAWLYVYGVMPEQIDHINHNRADNRIKNLRNIAYAENSKNKTLSKNNKTGVSGIYFDKKRESFKVQIKSNGKNIFFGRYKDFEKAVSVRNSAYKELGFHPNHGLNS